MRSDYDQKEGEPTILSIWDSISMVERKRGLNWKEDDGSVAIIVLASRGYSDEHLQEEIPDIWPLCLEFREKGTVREKKVNPDFNLLAWAILEEDKYGV